jgi:hypothetical protein
MDKKQALAFLKKALDEAAASGAFKNLEYISAVIAAYNILAEDLKDKEDETTI